MRPLPTPPAPGKPVSATLIRQLIDAIRERTILPGRNTTVKRGPNGTTVDAAASDAAAAAAVPLVLHPWKVFGLTRSDDEANLFKIFAPGGELAGRKIYVGDESVPVDGLSLRYADGENGDYWSFDDENQITEDVSTLYIVVYLTPDTDGGSGDDEPQEFKFAAEMVLDPDEFKDESKVKAVYAVVPVANVCVLTDDGGVSSGSVAVQRLKTDVLYVSEYYR